MSKILRINNTSYFLTLWLSLLLTGSLVANPQTNHRGPTFIENKGQWDESIRFAADIPGGKMLLMEKGITYLLTEQQKHTSTNNRYSQGSTSFEAAAVTVEFANANPSVKLAAKDAETTVYNYYLHKDRNRWATGCQAFRSVTYHEVYPGIDLKVYTDNHTIKYDLILNENADPAHIQLEYHGQNALTLEDGCVFASTNLGTITENRPLAYQSNDLGRKTTVACTFTLDDQVISFSLPQGYQQGQELVIDPELIFSTFSGTGSDNFGYTACFDEDGNLYSGGIIFGPDLTALNKNGSFRGTTDMAILKFDSTGTDLLYGTFIGGNSGDSPHSIVVNTNNELVIMGTTGSDDYPVSTNTFDTTYNGGNLFDLFHSFDAGTDIVLTKLGPSGNLLASTYVGGPGNDGILKMNAIGNYLNGLIQNYGDYQRGDVIIDSANNVYVASSTDSSGFPVTSSVQSTYAGGHSDAVVFSLNSDLASLDGVHI